MCASKLCENGKCSKSGYQDPCATSTQCMSGSCTMQFTCGSYGCYFPSFCGKSPNGSPCVDASDCGTGSSCSGSVVGSKSGTCIADPAATTTRTAIPTSGPSTTSVKTTSASTSTKPATTATTSKSTTTTTSKSTTTTRASTTSKTTTKATSTTALPSAAACTANAVCKSSYCRKTLLSDGVTRASTGKCDVKKATGARCYQNGGCLTGTCDKTKGVCV
ncbi:hypothetical protein CF327_g7182 [Tilletia walkeri]|nr:hypothetical protein CF327_g7182 [Tilletia walkeri]